MTNRPIIFSAPMVRALLDGRKSQTRRVLNLPTKTHSGGLIYERRDMGGWAATTIGGRGCFTVDREGNRIPAPEQAAIWHQTTGTTMAAPYAPGDRLYVREACKPIPDSKPGGYYVPGSPFYGVDWFYRADNNCPLWADGRWRPSIHMPRSASRITLTVTEVRVQRLQEISEADAVAEGISAVTRRFPPFQGCPQQLRERTIYEWTGGWSVRATDAYRALWDSLHGPDAWDENPWVVAITFTTERRNIDAI